MVAITVCEIGKTILKVTLTNTEVLGCFGNYEKLYTMNYSIQTAINHLLRDIIAEHKAFFKSGNITVGIKAIKNYGCEITLYSRKAQPKNALKEYTFCFSNSENLTKCILQLYGSKKIQNLKSSLYKMLDNYYLIIKTDNACNLLTIGEFCDNKKDSDYFAEYIKEHGKPIIKSNAIKRYGIAFSKLK